MGRANQDRKLIPIREAIKLNKQDLKKAKTPHERDKIRMRINILKRKQAMIGARLSG